MYNKLSLKLRDNINGRKSLYNFRGDKKKYLYYLKEFYSSLKKEVIYLYYLKEYSSLLKKEVIYL